MKIHQRNRILTFEATKITEKAFELTYLLRCCHSKKITRNIQKHKSLNDLNDGRSSVIFFLQNMQSMNLLKTVLELIFPNRFDVSQMWLVDEIGKFGYVFEWYVVLALVLPAHVILLQTAMNHNSPIHAA